MYQPRHLQREVVCCEKLLMSYDSDTVSSRAGGRHYSKKHIGCCGSGLAASMGESATAIGSGRAVCPMPASSRRPRPTARSGSWPGVLEWLQCRFTDSLR